MSKPAMVAAAEGTHDYFLLYLKDASVMSAVVVGTVVVRTFALSKQSERPLLAREHKLSNGAKGLGILAP